MDWLFPEAELSGSRRGVKVVRLDGPLTSPPADAPGAPSGLGCDRKAAGNIHVQGLRVLAGALQAQSPGVPGSPGRSVRLGRPGWCAAARGWGQAAPRPSWACEGPVGSRAGECGAGREGTAVRVVPGGPLGCGRRRLWGQPLPAACLGSVHGVQTPALERALGKLLHPSFLTCKMG